jgi:hypothetical protein
MPAETVPSSAHAALPRLAAAVPSRRHALCPSSPGPAPAAAAPERWLLRGVAGPPCTGMPCTGQGEGR